MSLIVEDGSGLAGAESYGSVADADAYHAARGGDAAWSVLDIATKEQHLRNGTAFMVRAYRTQWAGSRVSGTQRLDWPRYGVTVDTFAVAGNVVPGDVQEACFELALRAIDGELIPDLEIGNNQVKREKVGPLDTEYFQSNVDAAERFPVVTAIVRPYFGTAVGTATIKLVRA